MDIHNKYFHDDGSEERHLIPLNFQNIQRHSD